MIFMYRAGEARQFGKLEDVPSGEGWQDTPVTPFGDMQRVYDHALGVHVFRDPNHKPAAKPKPAVKKAETKADGNSA